MARMIPPADTPRANPPAFMVRFASIWILLAAAAATVTPSTASAPADPPRNPADPAAIEFFEKRIRPLLADHCHTCHGSDADKRKAGLRVDSRQHLLQGGDTGPALVPGEPDRSLILRAVRYDDPDLQMPPKTRLPAAAIEDLQRWIALGAPWPATASSENTPTDTPDTDNPPPTPSHTRGFDVAQRRADHWAWQPVTRPTPPTVRRQDWPASAIDRFVLARLEAAGLPPAPRAPRATRLRRASFALTGLPPTPAEVAGFERDPRPDPVAFAARVDALLDSPHFGERWARHWLDKVRYAETMGHEFDYPILGAWQYRDYVVRAFNQDLPWSTFTREQIAGDLLPEPRRNPADGTADSLVATTQFWLLQQVHSPVDVRAQQSETIDNQIDVVTKAFQGLTVSCARCHDHKFDAISTRDYYALHGILGSSRHAYRAIDNPAPRLQTAANLRALRASLPGHLAPTLLAFLESHPATPIQPTPNLGPLQLRPGDTPLPRNDWFADGEAFLPDAALPSLPTAPTPISPNTSNAPNPSPALRLAHPGWIHSGALARRFQGSLRSHTFDLDHDFIHLRVAGSGARFSIAVEGFPLLRSPIYGPLRQTVHKPDPHWVTVDVSMWKGRRAWLDFSDISEADPATELPPQSRLPDGWIAVADVILSTNRHPPATPTAPLPPDLNPATLVQRWADDPSSLAPHEAAWLDGLLAAARDTLPPALTADWIARDQATPAPTLATVMADGTGVDEPVFIRGNHRTHGPIVPRRFLEALAPAETPAPHSSPFLHGSGRLALADAITAPDNPLFDRVAVNWFWAHLFGRGLVASVDNFGVLGEPPSHPELLDWLASEFRQHGHSPKTLIRALVTSETWQMASRNDAPDAALKDPDNLLLHRANTRRLEGETLRDAMLAVSGRLNPRIGGPPVPVHLTPFMEGRGRPDKSGPADGDGRRSLYLEVRRNFLSPFMLAFDQPVPATTVGRRSVSNVPAQALALMNDPFVADQARLWAENTLRAIEGPAESRVRHLFTQAFARQPSPEETSHALAFLDAQLEQQDADLTRAWTDLCHALINAKEFGFIH